MPAVHRERSWAQSAFVSASVHQRQQFGGEASANAERADSLRPVHLVRADRDQIGCSGNIVERKPRSALHRVHVKQRSVLPDQGAELRDVGDGSDLVIDVHKRYENGVRPQDLGKAFGGDRSVAVRTDAINVEALGFEPGRSVQDRLVLQSRRDDVRAAILAGKRGSLHGEIDRLGRAGGPDDFPGPCRKQLRDFLAGLFNGVRRNPA